MNIYKVERTDMVDYDEFDSFVCFAENAKAARNMPPQKIDHYSKAWGETWIKKEDVNTLKVTLIGNGKAKRERVILNSFNAG